MVIAMERRRFTVEEYHRMGEAGILSEDERVELIEGEIVEMTPIGSRHAGYVIHLNHLFSKALGDRALVSVQNPVRLSEITEPEPDLTLLRPRADRYIEFLPRPDDVLLLVEVAESRLEKDLKIKVPLYARAGICEVWVIDIEERVVEVHRRASPDGYQVQQRFARGDSIRLEPLPDLEILADELFIP